MRAAMTLLLAVMTSVGAWADDAISVTSSTTSMTDATYQVTSNVTISERIQISGTVNLILGEGATLTAKDGIEVPTGATLIIDGTGSLVAKPTTPTNYGNGGGKSGIGGYLFGNIIINGGNITAEGCYGGAGIGGDQNNHNNGDLTLSKCGDITINGGVVNAKGSSSGNYSSAGIGGGIATWGDENNHYRGIFRTITINGGQVTADRIGNPSNKSRGTLVMNWTNLNDFIQATTYSASSISFTKQFLLDGTTTIATASNINGNKIVPLRLNLADATISGLSNTYTYTGTPININYTVAYNGTTLTAGTDYSAQITKGGAVVTEVKEVGEYTLTLTGKGNYTGTKSTTFSVVALSLTNASISGLNNTYTYTGTPININYTVAFNGTTLTAGTDYSAQITKGGAVVTEVKEVGEYTLTITGKGNYTGTKSTTFSVEAISLTNASISGIEPTYYYTDTPINLSYTVTHGGTTLTKGTDYTAKITKGTENTEVTTITEAGNYTLTITGISNYTGSLAQGFEVIAIPELISGGFTVDGGQATNWTSSGSNESYDKLVDGNLSTKYGLSNYDPWVEFHYSYPIPVKGYVLWTANDQEGKRNPRSWTIKAKNEGDTGWTTLATVNNSNGDKLPMANETATSFYINNSNSYQYFRFEATKSNEFQLAELQFYTTPRVFRDFLYLTVDGIAKRYNYTGSAINISHTVTSLEGDILTQGTDYEVTYTRGGSIVQEVKDKGTYTMTFTGIGKYTGTKSLSFNVEDYIEIGNANSSISDCPTDVQNKYSLSQQIYTTTELGVAKTIKSIGFYNTKQGCSRNLEIYMTLTDRSSYNIVSGGYYVEEWVPVDTTEDLVFRGNVTFLKDDWTTIPLDMPFVYDGQHNVAIMIYDKTAVENSSSLNFRAYSVDTYQSADASSSYPEYTPKRPANGLGTKQKNQLLLSIDDLPTCFKPHNIAIDYTGGKTASLSWANGSEGQTAWQICINDGKSDRIIDVTTNPYTLTGLEFATNYAIKMRTNCGNGNYSDWTNVINFATDFCERENMCNISFDLTSSLGYLWLGNAIEVVDAQTGFLLGRVSNYATSSELYIPVTSHDVVLVPAGREIKFRWVKGDDPNYCSWAIYDVNGDELFSGAGNYNMNTGTILYTYTVDCTSNPYKMPTELTCTKVTGTTATLNWTEKGSATAWQICLNDDENNLINVSTIPYTLNGLTPEKTYNAKVRAYGSDGYSRWTNNISFLPSAKRHIGSASSTDYNLPTATYSSYCLTEQIYTAAELGSTANFTSIDFYAVSNSCIRNLDIYMVHTDKSSFDEGNDWVSVTAADKVFSGDVTFVKNAWTTIEFDNVFSYDGQHNVVLVVDDNTGVALGSYGNNPPQFNCFGTSKVMTLRSNANIFDLTNLSEKSGEKFSSKNEIRIGVAEFSSVPRPQHLTCMSFTATTATLSWTEQGTATAWQICLNDDENNLIDVDSNPYTLKNLTAETIYTAKVRSVSGNEHSIWSKSVSFEPSGKIRIGSGTNTSQNLPTFTPCYTLTEQIYTTAEMGSTPGEITSVDFFNTGAAFTTNMDIYMVITDKISFDTALDWECVNLADRVFSGGVTFVQNAWTTITFDKSFFYDGESNVILVVDDNQSGKGNPTEFYVYESGANQAIYCYGPPIDPTSPTDLKTYGGSILSVKNRVRLGFLPSNALNIPRPTELACTGYTTTTATLSWTEQGTATAWQICLNDDENNLIDANSNPFTLTNLATETAYTAKVRSVTADGESNWSSKVSFQPSDKLRIGTGESVFILPISTACSYCMSEQIYTAEEIGMAGIITSIDFYNSGNDCTRKLDIYMVYTDKSSFDGYHDGVCATKADLVFSGNVDFSQKAWTTITLTNPFSYDGFDNVALIVDDNTGHSSGDQYSFYVFNTDAKQAIYYSDGTNFDPTSSEFMKSYGGTYSVKNQIRLSINADNVPPGPNALACISYTTTSAILSWTERGSANEWQICLNDDEENLITVTTNPYTLTSLTEEMPYTAKVRAVTANGNSRWSDKVSFQPSTKLRIGSGFAIDYFLPTDLYWNYSMTQQIYTAAEIGKAGTITSIDFYCPGASCTRNLDIYMLSTNKSSFENNNDWVGVTAADKVFSGEVTFGQDAWTPIVLNTSFVYDGHSNVVLVVDDNTGNYVNGESSFYAFEATSQALFTMSDDTNLDPTNPGSYSGTVSNVKNQIRLGITHAAVAGDANGDGNVSITDAVAIVNYILTNGHPTGNFVFSAADMNGDKAITISDATAIVNRILKGEE